MSHINKILSELADGTSVPRGCTLQFGRVAVPRSSLNDRDFAAMHDRGIISRADKDGVCFFLNPVSASYDLRIMAIRAELALKEEVLFRNIARLEEVYRKLMDPATMPTGCRIKYGFVHIPEAALEAEDLAVLRATGSVSSVDHSDGMFSLVPLVGTELSGWVDQVESYISGQLFNRAEITLKKLANPANMPEGCKIGKESRLLYIPITSIEENSIANLYAAGLIGKKDKDGFFVLQDTKDG